MKQKSRFLPGTKAATLAAAVTLGSVTTGPAHAEDATPLNERLVVSDGSTATHSGLAINHAEHALPTVLSENPGSRIELLDSSIIARLIQTDGSIDHLTAMAVQAKNGSTLSLDGVTLNAFAQGGTVGSRAMGISVRNELDRDNNTTSLTANNVNITVEGSSLQAHDGYGVGVVYPGANLTLTGNSVITAIGGYHYGIFAAAGGTVTSTGTTISTSGQRGIGVYANAATQGGAVINLNSDSVTTTGDAAHGLFSMRESGENPRRYGHTSTINANDITVVTHGAGSVGAFADRGGNVHLTDGSVTTHGDVSAGIATSAMTSSPQMAVPSTLTASGTSVTTHGQSSYGVAAKDGGDATLTNVTVITNGTASHALFAKGTVDLSTIEGSLSIDPNIVDGTPARIAGTGVIASASSTTASAALAEDGAIIGLKDSHLSGSSFSYDHGVVHAREEGTIQLDGGSVTHTLENNFGNAVTSANYGSLVQLNNVSVSTNAVGLSNTQLAAGVYAQKGGRVEIADSTIATSGNRAIGLRVAHTNSSIATEDTEVVTQGDGAHGVHVISVNQGTEYNVRADLDGGRIRTSGTNAYGLYSQHIGSTITSSADIFTTGVTGFGAYAYREGQIDLLGGTIVTEGDNGATAGTYGLIAAEGGKITGHGNTTYNGETSRGINVTTYGIGASAVRADLGGEISLTDATIATIGANAHAVEALNAGSSIHINRGVISTADASSSAAHVSDHASLNIYNSSLSGSTAGGRTGLVHADTNATMVLSAVSVSKVGEGAGNAIYAGNGARIDLNAGNILNASNGDGTGNLSAGIHAHNGATVNVSSSEIATTGSRAYGIRTSGDNAMINVVDSVISTDGDNAHAVQAYVNESGTQYNNINISGGEIYTEGSESWGLYAQNAGARITSSADIETTGANGFGAYAINGGEIYLEGGRIVTSGGQLDPLTGVGSIGVMASGEGSRISGIGNISGASSGVQILTSGANASAAVAAFGGNVSLRDASLQTTGTEAYGIHALAGSWASVTNTDITTTGSRSSALRVDHNAQIATENSRIRSSFYGVQIGNNENSNGSVHLRDTDMRSEHDAFFVHFGSQNAETVNIRVDGNSEISAANNVLLNVNRIASAAGDHAQVVNFELGTPEGSPASGKTTVARGNIFDTSAHKGPNDLLNIYVGQDARLYSDTIAGYNTITVHGQINNNNQSTGSALNVGLGQSVTGTGVITKDVVVDGGSLATSVRVRGNLDLGESAREEIEVGEGQSVTVDAGKQAIITTVSNAQLDASQGAAVISEVSGGATVKTGNWGATIAQVSGGVVNASEGTANIANFSNATLHTGSGGATVGTFSGGVISGSTAEESQVVIGELSSGTASTVTLVVSNDGSSSSEPAGNVNLYSGTIGGNGKVNAALALSGSTFAAGSSVGRLDIADNLSFDAESIYQWEINDATGTAGTYAGGWDYSEIDGLLSFEAGAVFSVNSLGLDNLVGEIANFDEFNSYSWLVAVATLGIDGWEQLLLETDAFLNTYSGSFALSVLPGTGSASELYLVYTAVPEPATLALILGSVTLLATAALRRRGNRKAV